MRRITASLIFMLGLAVAAANLTLPGNPKSVKLAVIGDGGTGETPQYEVGQQMADYHTKFPFDFVLMLGDNIYGHQSAGDFRKKFEDPYKALLSQGVKFYASLGNHDSTTERMYKPFNMDGKRYYDFKKGDAEFFALDSNYMDPEQLDWLTKELSSSNSKWKVCFFHHPLYSDGRMHGPDLDLRKQLEPIFEQYGVNVVLAGHEHFYERTQPHNGIAYFVLGNSGQLRPHNVRTSPDVAKAFDTDQAFALLEIDPDQLYYQIISRTGETVDSGSVTQAKVTR
ncbi:MAG TPA: metallophosphoesterase [Candidatus Sulfopaludibacter sp.]|jgi:3',5'-cyclic AMP phosphodiesterase CpdA|nr:metallophosphoesterase [Candidatus Sulfopaludibacter sp.]